MARRARSDLREPGSFKEFDYSATRVNSEEAVNLDDVLLDCRGRKLETICHLVSGEIFFEELNDLFLTRR